MDIGKLIGCSLLNTSVHPWTIELFYVSSRHVVPE